MSETAEILAALDARAKRREERRDFFRMMGVAAAAVPAVMLTMNGSPLHAQAAPTDGDVLNFALNLEYLEAQFYSFAFTGAGLPASKLDGTGTRGNVRGGRQVAFTDPIVSQHAAEITADEIAHVDFLRTALGAARVAMPEIDISSDPNGAFSNAARAAGLIGAGQSFDPYASDEAFLLGAFIFEDVGVTAYKGAAALLTNKTFLEAAAGILAVEAYHAAMVRTTLFRKGVPTPTPPALDLIGATEAISTARDNLDGASDIDQGVRPIGNASNIAPLDANGLAFSRSAGQVLNVVYLNRMATTAGGFFPNGVNGTIRTSAAS